MTATLEAPAVTTVTVALLDLDRAAKLLRVTLPSRPVSRELAAIRVSGRDGVVTFETFDFETGARVMAPMLGDDFGPVLVEGRALLDALKGAGLGVRAVARRTADVTLTVPTDGPVLLTGPTGARLTVPPMSGAHTALPALPVVDGPSVLVAADRFASAVASVAPGASRDDTLPLLTGIRFTFEDAAVRLLTTDRYRLHEATVVALGGTSTRPDPVLLRGSMLAKLVKLAPPLEEVQLAVGEDDGGRHVRARLSWPGVEVTVMAIEGDYPAVDRLWPSSADQTVVVDRMALLGAVKTVLPFVVRNIPVQLDFGPDNVTVHNRNVEAPMSAAPVQAAVACETDGVAFNPSFLVDTLEALDGPIVTLHVTHPNKPVEFTDGGPARVLLVPCRFGA